MRFETTAIEGVLLLFPERHLDFRGSLSETFKSSALKVAGVDFQVVQENHSFSRVAGVVRGLHFQHPPGAQTKLLRVSRGAVFDVAVDIRRGSSTYGRHVAVEISAENWAQIVLPVGVAHGFCTLSDNTEVIYKLDNEYDARLEGGILWNDPDLAIAWPLDFQAATVSQRDSDWPRLSDLRSPF